MTFVSLKIDVPPDNAVEEITLFASREPLAYVPVTTPVATPGVSGDTKMTAAVPLRAIVPAGSNVSVGVQLMQEPSRAGFVSATINGYLVPETT